MAGTWNGASLLFRFYEKYGFRTTDAQARVLEWMNEIQEDICESYRYPFLKIKLKKQITSSEHEVNLSPQVPSAPSVAIGSGGSLTVDTSYYVKVTFLIYGEDTREFDSIESEPSIASAVANTTTGNLKISLTNIDTYDGDSSVKPTIIHRRIYLKKGTGNYVLYSTIADNTTTTLEITADTSSSIEPPEYSLVQVLSEDSPLIESSGIYLAETELHKIKQNDPNFTASGTPTHFARVSEKKILLYPKPSATITLSYWVYRIPSRIFNDSSRVIQLDHSLKKVLDEGVDWKGKAWKQDAQAAEILSNYEQLKERSQAAKGLSSGPFSTIKVVC